MKLERKSFNTIIILGEPNGPLNVGSVARLCKNFKVNELRIVSPKCDIFSLETTKMALKGINYINNCNLYETLFDAINDCDLVLASCGRLEQSDELNPSSLEEVSSWINSLNEINNLAVVFGREDRGLTNKELLLSNKVFTINANQNYPSLNLSHAVSIVLYELSKFPPKIKSKNESTSELATPTEIDICLKDMEKILKKFGYLLNHTYEAKMSKFKRFIVRAETSKHELNIIRGIIHQFNWALRNLN